MCVEDVVMWGFGVGVVLRAVWGGGRGVGIGEVGEGKEE